MSTAYYPQGMRTMPASGYNHNSSNNCKQYIPWKGTGLNNFPVVTATGHKRPLTNNTYESWKIKELEIELSENEEKSLVNSIN